MKKVSESDLTYLSADKKEVMRNAIYDGYSITRHEKYADGEIHTSALDECNSFIYEGQLYIFMRHQGGAIQGFFPLNQDPQKEDCKVFFTYTISR